MLAFIAGLSWLFEQVSRAPTVASDSLSPYSVSFSNVSESSVAATWLTKTTATGSLKVVAGGQSYTGFDQRDTDTARLNKYYTHSVTVRNLAPNTTYKVTLISDGRPFLKDGNPYQITTAPALPVSTSTLEPAYGVLTTVTNEPAEGAIVLLTPEGGQTLSTLVKASGAWLIPLNLVRTENLLDYLPGGERLEETILVQYRDEVASATTDTLNDGPVPNMTLGKSYDFRRQQALQSAEKPVAQAEAPAKNILGKQTVAAGKISLTAPANGAALTTNLPLIQGTGLPGKKVTVALGITNPTSGTTTVGADGLWRYTPSKKLAPGQQSVTITTIGQNNKPIALTHLFKILKSGTQVLGEATPSATLAPTPTDEEPAPTSALEGEPLPESGNTLPTLILLIIGFGLFTSGAMVLVRS